MSNVADKNGTWLKNEGEYALFDGTSNTRFEPQEPIKATVTDWVKAQPTIKVCADPSVDVNGRMQAQIDAANAAAEAEREAARVAAEATQAAARGETPPAPPAPTTPAAAEGAAPEGGAS